MREPPEPRQRIPADERVELFRSRDARLSRDLALLLEAVSIDHEVDWQDSECVVFVAAVDLPRSMEQVEAYARENRGWPPLRDDSFRPISRGAAGTFWFALVMLLGFWIEQNQLLGWDWRERGAADAGRILSGQWWRVITALTLHSGWIHFSGNLVFGCWFHYFLAQSVGGGVAAACFLVSGALGNLLAAASRTGPTAAIGASTAVFGAVGALAAIETLRRGRVGRPRLQRLVPLVIGVVFLGLFGTSGDHTGVDRTDVVGHFAGFLAGGVLGALLGRHRGEKFESAALQFACAAAALAGLVLAWLAALGPPG